MTMISQLFYCSTKFHKNHYLNTLLKAAGPKDTPLKTLNIVNVFTLTRSLKTIPWHNSAAAYRLVTAFKGVRIPELEESELREYFAFGKSEPWALDSGIPLKEYGIPLTVGIQNPISTDKD